MQPRGRPVLGGKLPAFGLVPFQRFHHLADHPVGQQHDRIAVAVGDVKRLLHQIDRLLNRVGREDDETVIAVAAAAGGLIIIPLRGLDGAQPGTAAHHIDNDGGQLRAGHIGNPFLLEADAGAGRRGNGAGARAGRAVDHIDGGKLRLGL